MPAPAAPGIAALAGTAAGITVALSVATAIVFAAQIRTVLESQEALSALLNTRRLSFPDNSGGVGSVSSS